MAEDSEAFDALYLDARDRLVMQVAAICGDAVEAADFVQEAFIRAWARWPRIGAYDDPEGWVRRVAVHQAIGRWRVARRLVLHERIASPQVDTSPEQEAVIQALAGLSVRPRHAMVLHYLVGLSVEETAAEMAVPAGTVKSWLSRSRAHLAIALVDHSDANHSEAVRPSTTDHAQEVTQDV